MEIDFLLNPFRSTRPYPRHEARNSIHPLVSDRFDLEAYDHTSIDQPLTSRASRAYPRGPLEVLHEPYYKQGRTKGAVVAAAAWYGRQEAPMQAWAWREAAGEVSHDMLLEPLAQVVVKLEGGFKPCHPLPCLTKAVSEGWSYKSLASCLLDKISHVLTPKALSPFSPTLQPHLGVVGDDLEEPSSSSLGVNAFLHPLVELRRVEGRGRGSRHRAVSVEVVSPSPCMVYDVRRVKENMKDYLIHDKGYLKLVLGHSLVRREVKKTRQQWSESDQVKLHVEWAHRIVCWAVWGPPGEGQEVLHTCHNPKCLSTLHVKWGSHLENMAAK